MGGSLAPARKALSTLAASAYTAAPSPLPTALQDSTPHSRAQKEDDEMNRVWLLGALSLRVEEGVRMNLKVQCYQATMYMCYAYIWVLCTVWM